MEAIQGTLAGTSADLLAQTVGTQHSASNSRASADDAFYRSLAMSNAVSQQNQERSVALAATARSIRDLVEPNAEEARSIADISSKDSTASQGIATMAGLGFGQIGGKIAGDMPPVSIEGLKLQAVPA